MGFLAEARRLDASATARLIRLLLSQRQEYPPLRERTLRGWREGRGDVGPWFDSRDDLLAWVDAFQAARQR